MFARNLTKFGRAASSLRISNLQHASNCPNDALLPSVSMVHNFSLSNLRLMATAPSYEMIKVEQKGEGNQVGVVTLNRPKALNALCGQLMDELVDAVENFNKDSNVAVIILTGNEKAFAAGADIKEMEDKEFANVFMHGFLDRWNLVTKSRKPLIAAVNGFALGGGCELAMMCDIIIAGEKARFGQPEINIGTIPGAGGTQRLTKAIGKSRSMQMCLTGEMINAQQANDWGLVSSVHPPEKLMDAALEIAEKIGKNSQFTVALCKESVNNSFEMSLKDGLSVEKRLFHVTFATHDRKEGMSAFVEKRKPNFKHK